MKMMRSRNRYRLLVTIASAAFLSSCGWAADRETSNAAIVEQGRDIVEQGRRLEAILSVIASNNSSLATIPEEAGCYEIFVWTTTKKDSYLLNECTGSSWVMVAGSSATNSGISLKRIANGPSISIEQALGVTPSGEARIYQIIASGFNDTSTYLLNTETGDTWNLNVDRPSTYSEVEYNWERVSHSE